MLKNEKIARRYARAYLNVFQKLLSVGDIAALESLVALLKKNRIILAYLVVPRWSNQEKKIFLTALFTQLKICPSFKKLTFVLLQHRSIELLTDIAEYVLFEDRKRHGKQEFAVTSSHLLSVTEQQLVIDYLVTMTSCSIDAVFTIDPTLIYGIKLQSESFQFDNSVAKKLKEARQNLLRQVEI